MNALIVLCLQNDFSGKGSLKVPESEKIVPIVNRMSRDFDIVVAVRDWHPSNHDSFACNHVGRKVGDLIEFNGVKQRLWPPHCVQNTPGADFMPQFDTSKVRRVFSKGVLRTSYTCGCFSDSGGTGDTGIDFYLRQKNVDTVYITGLMTDYGIKSSAIDAVSRNFTTCVVIDACRGLDFVPGDTERAITEMVRHGVRIITSDTLLIH